MKKISINLSVMVIAALVSFGFGGPDNQINENKISAVSVSPEMINVVGGTFTMGNAEDFSARPTHKVFVSSFLIGKYEVTQRLWTYVMGYYKNPSKFRGENHPVEQVSWYDAVKFCNALSENEGLQKAYSGSGDNIKCDFTSNGYRLLTEAEWEYAARGGDRSRGYEYSGSNDLDQVSWNDYNSRQETKEVRWKLPNELGIYDMSGNVAEWCWDQYGKYSQWSETNPKGTGYYGSGRVIRGGSWDDFGARCRVSARGSYPAEEKSSSLGFRLARSR